MKYNIINIFLNLQAFSMLFILFQSPEIDMSTSNWYSKNANTTIIKAGLTREEALLIRDIHNYLRADVRLGLERRGSAGPQPAALDAHKGIPVLVVAHTNFFVCNRN